MTQPQAILKDADRAIRLHAREDKGRFGEDGLDIDTAVKIIEILRDELVKAIESMHSAFCGDCGGWEPVRRVVIASHEVRLDCATCGGALLLTRHTSSQDDPIQLGDQAAPEEGNWPRAHSYSGGFYSVPEADYERMLAALRTKEQS